MGAPVGSRMATTWLADRFEPSSRTLGLALGDMAMIAVFVGIGELRHGGGVAAGLETFGQFAIGWGLVALAAGVYGPTALETWRRAVVQGVAAWIVAALVGQLLRVLVTPGGSMQPAFVLVSVASGGLLLGAWRYIAARVAR